MKRLHLLTDTAKIFKFFLTLIDTFVATLIKTCVPFFKKYVANKV